MPLSILRSISTTVKRLKTINPEKQTMASHIYTLNPNAVACAVERLSYGEIIALPTDTVYGLACSAIDAKAINKLYAIKGRSDNKPLAICLSDVEDVKNWARVDHLPDLLLSTLLPGPVTLVLNCTNQLDNSLISTDGKIGIRIPDHTFVRAVVQHLKHPIALTSANTSGNPSSITTSEFQNLWSRLTCVFEHGILGSEINRAGSTVVDLSYSGFYKLLRPGLAADQTKYILNSHGLENRQ